MAHSPAALVRKCVKRQDPLELWGSPDVVRGFIYIDDFLERTFRAIEALSGCEVFDICTGRNHTIGEALDPIVELADYKGAIEYNTSGPTTIDRRRVDPGKARERLGFSAETTLRDGLDRTIKWYRSTLG